MRHFSLLLLSIIASAADIKQDVVVKINDKEYTINEGSEINVGDLKVSAKIAKYKTFFGSNYRFKIPSDFALEKDESDKECFNYTFDGKNVVFDIYEINSSISGDEFIDAVISEINKSLKVKNSKVQKASEIKLLNKMVTGKLTKLPIAGNIQNKMFYSITCGEQKLVIGLQRSDDKIDVVECDELIQLLGESFVEIKK